jgi:hypothetical protein
MLPCRCSDARRCSGRLTWRKKVHIRRREYQEKHGPPRARALSFSSTTHQADHHYLNHHSLYLSSLSIAGHGWGGIAGSFAPKRGAPARRSPCSRPLCCTVKVVGDYIWGSSQLWCDSGIRGACSSGATPTWRTDLVLPSLEQYAWRPKPECRPAA